MTEIGKTCKKTRVYMLSVHESDGDQFWIQTFFLEALNESLLDRFQFGNLDSFSFAWIATLRCEREFCHSMCASQSCNVQKAECCVLTNDDLNSKCIRELLELMRLVISKVPSSFSNQIIYFIFYKIFKIARVFSLADMFGREYVYKVVF